MSVDTKQKLSHIDKEENYKNKQIIKENKQQKIKVDKKL